MASGFRLGLKGHSQRLEDKRFTDLSSSSLRGSNMALAALATLVPIPLPCRLPQIPVAKSGNELLPVFSPRLLSLSVPFYSPFQHFVNGFFINLSQITPFERWSYQFLAGILSDKIASVQVLRLPHYSICLTANVG